MSNQIWVLLLCGSILCSMPALSAQTQSVVICAVQRGEEYAEPAAMDARELVHDLSPLSLANGHPIRAVVIEGIHRTNAEAQIEQRGCDWIVDLWRQEAVDADISGRATAGGGSMAGSASQGAVYFEMKKEGVQKPILKGVAPSPVVYGQQGHRRVTPFPLIAAKVVDKINKSDNGEHTR